MDKVNKILEAGEPNNISEDSYTGYSGYSPQSVIDALNEAIGNDGWGFDEISNEVITINTKEGEGQLALANVKVWVGNRENYRTAYGQSRVTRGDTGDAMKGAQTDALKKALSYFSVGNRAYLGLLDKKKTSKPVVKIAPKIESNRPLTQDDILDDFTGESIVEEVTKAEKAKSKSDTLRKKYFAIASKIPGIKDPKDYIKEKLEVKSFNDISDTKLEFFIKALENKYK